jgi:hypothetical protein
MHPPGTFGLSQKPVQGSGTSGQGSVLAKTKAPEQCRGLLNAQLDANQRIRNAYVDAVWRDSIKDSL